MIYIKSFNEGYGKGADLYKYKWCNLNSPIRLEIELSVKDILTELVEEGLYEYKIFWTSEDPSIIIFSTDYPRSRPASEPRCKFDIDLVQPFADQINSYLNSEGFKTGVEYRSFESRPINVKISFNDVGSQSTYFKYES